MATIYPDSQYQSMARAPQVSQAPSSNNQDPLFEALVKYITASPGASSVTASNLEEIINSHSSVPGGRAYLESVVSLDPVISTRIWSHQADAEGYVSTNMASLTLRFTSPRGYVRFNGDAVGFFGPSVWPFENAQYYYDEPLTKDVPVTMEVRALPQHKQVIVDFFPEVQTEKKAIAQLVINNAGLRLPPQGADGRGALVVIFTTQ